MEKLTLTLAQDQGHEEQGRVRHQGRRGHPERLHRQGRSGRRSTGHAPGGHIRTVSPRQPPWLGNRGWETALGRRAGENDVKRTAGDPESDTTATGPTGPE